MHNALLSYNKNRVVHPHESAIPFPFSRYLSIAFLSDHTNRNRLVLLSQEKSARQDFNLMQDFLFPNQSCDDDCPQSCAMDKIMEFVESSISMSIVFM